MPQFRCKHKERIENKEVHSPAWEQMSDAEHERVEPAPWMFARRVDIMLICTKCGRRKTVTSESSPGIRAF